MTGRKHLGLALLVTASSWGGLAALMTASACSDDDSAAISTAGDAQAGQSAEDATIAPTPTPVTSGDSSLTPVIFGDDAGGGSSDGAPGTTCFGSPVPTDATTPACAIDTTSSCPACASWGFVCATWASPQLQAASASTFCSAAPFDGGALICCTHAACVVSNVAGGCDASTGTRYECNGGAVPSGTCSWLGANAPNDYCCQ